MIKVNSITKSYRRRNKQFNAVSDVSFDQNAGDFTGIIGHSGSGKSTLIHMIAGLITPTSGSVLYKNRDIYANQSDEDRSHYINSEIGFIPQQATLISSLKFLEKKHKQGVSILFVTHKLATLVYTNQVYTMTEGKLTLGNHLL